MKEFKDLKVGDIFEAQGDKMIKIRNSRDTCKPLPKRKTNAINLSNRHEIVVGDKVPVTLIEEVTI